MPVTYSFLGEVLELRASGSYQPAAVEQAFRAAIADQKRPRLRALLYDVRDSQVVAMRSTADVREAVAFFKGLAAEVGQRVAMVASTDAAYGVMRMVAGWADGAGIDAAVFRDHDHALEWASR